MPADMRLALTWDAEDMEHPLSMLPPPARLRFCIRSLSKFLLKDFTLAMPPSRSCCAMRREFVRDRDGRGDCAVILDYYSCLHMAALDLPFRTHHEPCWLQKFAHRAASCRDGVLYT